MMTKLFLALAACVLPSLASEFLPRHYTCARAATPIHIDGKLDDAAWNRAPWTGWFVDIRGGSWAKPRFRTRAKMLWDDENLYVAAQLEEPDVWGTLTEHDSVIFRDNDFEVFLNPTGDTKNYFEFEINALNTGWDLFLPKPYNQGGKADNSWEIPGLRTAVAIQGTLNKPGDRDHGWTVEIAFPWTAFRERSGAGRPEPGAEWRINFSRVEWRVRVADGKYEKLPGREDNWVWSPQGVVNMHVPEHWGFVKFKGR
ncbi:MAG TPA: carbohydrate-binding family 9-like protein [Bryobacteraceae bacterium]